MSAKWNSCSGSSESSSYQSIQPTPEAASNGLLLSSGGRGDGTLLWLKCDRDKKEREVLATVCRPYEEKICCMRNYS